MHQADVVLPVPDHIVVRNTPRWLKYIFRGYALLITICISLMYVLALSALAAQLDESTFLRSLVVGAITFLFYTIAFVISLLFAFGFYKQRSFIIWPSIVLGLDAALVMYQTLVWYQSMISNLVLVIVVIVSIVYIGLAIIVVHNRCYFVPQELGVSFSIVLSLAFIPPIIMMISSLTADDLSGVNDDYLLTNNQYIKLPKHENAYYSLPSLDSFPEEKRATIVNALAVYQRYVNGTEVSDSELFKAMEGTRFITDAFLFAADQNGYQCPEALDVNNYNANLCTFGTIHEYVYLTELRSHALLRQEDYQGSVSLVEAMIQFAHRLEETKPTPLLQYLVSGSLTKLSYEAGNRLLDQLDEVESDEVEAAKLSLLSTLERNRPDKNKNLIDTLRYSYTSTKSDLRKDLSTAKTSYFWHPNRTMQAFADVWLLSVQFAEKPCGEGKEIRTELSKMIDLQREKSSTLTGLLFKPNVIGNNISSMMLTPLAPIKDKACEVEWEYNKLLQRLEN